MNSLHRATLTALYAALLGVLEYPLPENTRERLGEAARALARDLGVPCPLPTREERRAGRLAS
jgi:hypothetical protein